MQSPFKLLVNFFLLVLLQGITGSSVMAQTTESRIVGDRKVYICTMSDRDTFQTAAEGCRHWAKEHLPAGYKYKEGSSKTQPNGAVYCLCQKQGQSDNDQQGMIMGIIICPENASELNVEPASFEDRKCQCYETYVSYNGKCVKPEEVPATEPTAEITDECDQQQGLTPQQVELKNKVVQRLQEVVNDVNKQFAKDPTISKSVFTGPELARYGEGTFKKYLWNQGYGHAIERLTAAAIKNDRLLNSTLEYIPNVQQTQGLPDFKGKGQLPSTLSFDITTEGQVDRKKTKGKECWEFITYKRLVNADGTRAR